MANSGKIYLLSDKGKLSEMNESIYDSEEVLQSFLASYPHLLAGEQIRPDEPRKWLLVKREIGIPGEQAEGDRWSLDHLFVDQNGVPTFVECKRSADTRIRREVVGQMLDYAANAIAYWPMDKLRQSAAETATQANSDLNQLILSLLESSVEEDREAAIEEFWALVENNLREGRLRLLFISDGIPAELRRVVEFLNAQMSRTEVFAVEVKQYSGGGATVLVPRVLGSVTKIKEPTSRRSTAWTESEFLEDLRSRKIDGSKVSGIEGFLMEARKLETEGAATLSWGKGKESGSFTIKKKGNSFLSISSSAYIWLNMGGWRTLPLDARTNLAEELGKKLRFDLKYADHSNPNIAEKVFARVDGIEKLVEWLKDAIRITEQGTGET